MERVIAGLSAAQAAAGHRVSVVTLGRALTDGRVLEAGEHRGVVYRRLQRIGPRRYPFAVGLRKAVRGADLVHVHGIDGLADQLVGHCRVGVSTHGGYLHTRRNWWVKQVMLRTWTRRTLSRANALWFTSEADRMALAGLGVPGTVVPNGVDLDPFLALSVKPQSGLWLAPGPVAEHKGHDRLINALGVLAQRDGRPFRLEITGQERTRGLVRRLRRLAEERGVGDRVRFTGALPPEAYRARLVTAQWVLFPSRYEGFGVSVVEAMAAGCRVVAQPNPAFVSHIDDGKTGHLVDFAEPGLAADLLASLRDLGPLRSMGEAARTSASGHRWSERLADWDRAYARVAP